MAWTEAGVNAQSNAAVPLGAFTIFRMIGGASVTDVYALGNAVPYQGRARWIQVLNSEDDAGAWTAIRTGLLE